MFSGGQTASLTVFPDNHLKIKSVGKIQSRITAKRTSLLRSKLKNFIPSEEKRFGWKSVMSSVRSRKTVIETMTALPSFRSDQMRF